MRPILFVAAEPREFSGYRKYCSDQRPLPLPVHWSRSAVRGSQSVWLVANGAGRGRAEMAVAAAAAMTTPECVVSTGFCGALDPELRIADIFVADRVDTATGSFPMRRPQVDDGGHTGHFGPLVSVDYIAESAEQKKQLRASGAGAVEMEAGGVAAEASRRGIPMFCIRSVSDLAGESFSLSLNAALRSDGRFDTIKILCSALCRPTQRVPELLRLRNRCELASEKLGEFLAKCRF